MMMPYLQHLHSGLPTTTLYHSGRLVGHISGLESKLLEIYLLRIERLTASYLWEFLVLSGRWEADEGCYSYIVEQHCKMPVK